MISAVFNLSPLINVMYKLQFYIYMYIYCFVTRFEYDVILQLQNISKGIQLGQNISNDFVDIFTVRSQNGGIFYQSRYTHSLVFFPPFVITYAVKWRYFHFRNEMCYHHHCQRRCCFMLKG